MVKEGSGKGPGGCRAGPRRVLEWVGRVLEGSGKGPGKGQGRVQKGSMKGQGRVHKGSGKGT